MYVCVPAYTQEKSHRKASKTKRGVRDLTTLHALVFHEDRGPVVSACGVDKQKRHADAPHQGFSAAALRSWHLAHLQPLRCV